MLEQIDIEGGEFEALDRFVDFFARPEHPHAPPTGLLPVGQMQLEIHARPQAGAYSTFEGFRRWWERLENAGLRPFFSEPNLVYVNIITGAPPDLSEVRRVPFRHACVLISGVAVLVHEHPRRPRARL